MASGASKPSAAIWAPPSSAPRAGAAWPAPPAAYRRTARSRRPVPLQRRPRGQHGVAGAGLRRLLEHLDARRRPSPPRHAPPPCRAPRPGRAWPRPPSGRWPARAPASSGRRWHAAPSGRASACARPCRRRERRSAGGGWSWRMSRRQFVLQCSLAPRGRLATCMPARLQQAQVPEHVAQRNRAHGTMRR